VQVADNLVSVLTNRAIPVNRLDAGSIQEQLRHALTQPAAGEDEIARRDKVVAQSRAQLRVARSQTATAHSH
jgi:F-type H+-transporting ATPase subunit epsilon